MQPKVFIGSTMAVALMGIGFLAGSVVGGNNVSAQTNSATPVPTAVAPSTNPPSTTDPQQGSPRGFGGMRGHGDRGFGGGMFGDNLTADTASQQITNTNTAITSAKNDLAYATGKMDTTDVQRWINGADSLVKSAQSAAANSQYGQAVSYAEAARELAMTADEQMAQKLGADKLPSASQRPQWGDRQGQQASTTLTQAQASRILAETYNRLVEEGTQVKSASNASEATPYLTDAQNAYKTAYNAYQAGNYTDAAASARLAGKLAGVAETIARASTAPANSTTPVTVPAPSF